MIHCIGDSHASFFSGNDAMQNIWPGRSNDILPYFKTYRIGPATAYQLHNKKAMIDSIVKNISKDDYILFCFGEVDCRLHLGLQMKKNIDAVQECVDRYFRVILHYKSLGYKVAVWGPIASNPPTRDYPAEYKTGSCEERNQITECFTKKLDDLCKQENIPLVTIFYDMVEGGITKDEYILDHIHLSQKAMPLAIEKFKEKGIICND